MNHLLDRNPWLSWKSGVISAVFLFSLATAAGLMAFGLSSADGCEQSHGLGRWSLIYGAAPGCYVTSNLLGLAHLGFGSLRDGKAR